MYHAKTLGNSFVELSEGDENPVTKLQVCISAMVVRGRVAQSRVTEIRAKCDEP